ncbi:MAG: UPF0147 family protein [Desulfurococcales archaeon]|nr:UPF0147 family protein [Desulfurococcales archaeon]RLG78190.1 MAG: hypothetical protein DRO14_01405 [Thermoprotei archaeon]
MKSLNEAKIMQAIRLLNKIIGDSSVPRNIRRAAIEALRMLQDTSLSPGVRAANAVSVLDEISQDPNMPMHARTTIWNIMAVLSTVKD